MKCNRCGIEIEETEMFCKDCKKVFRKISSRSEVEELEELIENQKQLTDLENTKELVNLDSLVEEELKKEEFIKDEINTLKIDEEYNEKTKTIDIVEELVQPKENDTEEKVEEPKKTNKKKSKKKLIIIISIISLVIIEKALTYD